MIGIKGVGLSVFILFALLYFSTTVFATPVLQTYVEDDKAYYDWATETWIIGSNDFTLNVMGIDNVAGVNISIAVPTGQGASGSLTVTQIVGDVDELTFIRGPVYGTPTLGDGTSLPSHGTYDTDFFEYSVGDFDTSETVYDMPYYPNGEKPGEVKRYSVQYSNFDWISIDSYNHVVVGQRQVRHKFAPFSHDSGATPIPEPGTLLLLGSGLAGLAGYGKLRLKRRRK